MKADAEFDTTRRSRRARILAGAAVAIASIAVSTGVVVATDSSSDKPADRANLYGRVDKILY